MFLRKYRVCAMHFVFGRGWMKHPEYSRHVDVCSSGASLVKDDLRVIFRLVLMAEDFSAF